MDSDSMNSIASTEHRRRWSIRHFTTSIVLTTYPFAARHLNLLRKTILPHRPPTITEIPLLIILDIFHDCSRVAFHWAASGIGSGADDVRGVDSI
jgi:hypothetical protein